MRKIYSFIFLLFSAFCFAQSPIKVACIGNSVTFGYGHTNPNETSYPQQLSKLLGDGYKVGNFGKSGATLLNKGHRPYTQQPECKAALEFAPAVRENTNRTLREEWTFHGGANSITRPRYPRRIPARCGRRKTVPPRRCRSAPVWRK